MLRFDRNSIYTDRRNKAALCYDYPADEVLINGLECMQAYLSARGNSIQIPIVRVMNTAHYISTYMHSIGCDDQTEFDVLINLDIRDRQLVPIVLITLAAMLKRTEGMRARVCRSVIMENRSEDFYEGVSLYEQWLEGRTEHYMDEDFHIDLMDEINMLKEEKRQWEREREEMIKQNIELITTIDKMEKEKHIINVSGNYIAEQHIDIHDNHNCNIYATEGPREQVKNEDLRLKNEDLRLKNEDLRFLASEKHDLKVWKNEGEGLAIPEEGKYSQVRQYIEERMRFDAEFKQLYNNRPLRVICELLTDKFGWFVDEGSLRRNLNRNAHK